MPKPATGSVRWVNGVAIARIRVTREERASFPMPTCTTDDEAQERSKLLADVAKRLRGTTASEEQARDALKLVAAAAPRSLRNALTMVDEIAGREVASVSVPGVQTFRQLGEEWTSGDLAKRFPDQIRLKRSAHTDVSRLTTYVYPLIGSVAIDRLTLDHCEEVMRRLPPERATATRRNVGQLITRLLTLAVYPLRLIERSPVPKGFLPGVSKPKALAYLYPDEDRRLLACAAVPLHYRLLWGFLAREGMREGEALALTWSAVDLTRGAIRLDQNKTDDPRAWPLDVGVLCALRRYKETHRPGAQPGDHVCTDAAGRPLALPGPFKLPALLRRHLKAIGLHEERPELFATTAERRRIRVHDLRGTFVTVALANGKSESWISDRTGHKSSAMIAKYKRNARTFAELDLGTLARLDESIPELLIDHGLATGEIEATESAVTSTAYVGAGNGIRTHDVLLGKQVLYH